jgi:hypothetical protein
MIRELNLKALAQRQENSTARCKVLPSAADLPAPLSSQAYVKPKLMGPHHGRDGMHPANMIKDLRAFIDNMQDATHRLTLYNSTREFVKHTCGKKTSLSDE